jgi:hypothetical protein
VVSKHTAVVLLSIKLYNYVAFLLTLFIKQIMADEIRFTRNYEDRSTDTGFQFEFRCERCDTGYRSQFKPSAIGTVSNVLDAASSILGGFFSNASNVTDRVKSAQWQQARDAAFKESISEISPKFIQCPRCMNWVCRDVCWNDKKGLCKQCAPDIGVEMAAAQASKTTEEIWAHAAMAEEDKKLGTEYWRKGIKASCPQCEAALPANTKFCPNCGANVQEKKNCSGCNAQLEPNTKFCPECGAKA